MKNTFLFVWDNEKTVTSEKKVYFFVINVNFVFQKKFVGIKALHMCYTGRLTNSCFLFVFNYCFFL